MGRKKSPKFALFDTNKTPSIKNILQLVSLRKWGPIDHHSDYAVAVDHLLQTDTK